LETGDIIIYNDYIFIIIINDFGFLSREIYAKSWY